MKAKYKLRAGWSKRDQDVLFSSPLGRQTKSDAMYIAQFFDKSFKEEMKSRGYDITSMRFSIDIDFNSDVAKERFPTLREQMKEELVMDFGRFGVRIE